MDYNDDRKRTRPTNFCAERPSPPIFDSFSGGRGGRRIAARLAGGGGAGDEGSCRDSHRSGDGQGAVPRRAGTEHGPELPHWKYAAIFTVHLQSGHKGYGETLLYYTWGATTKADVRRARGQDAAALMWDDSLRAGLQMALFDAAAYEAGGSLVGGDRRFSGTSASASSGRT